MSLIIFTNLDEILLPIGDRDYESVKILLEELRPLKVILVVITNNTRAEIEQLSQIGFADPFIVEHGSGVFLPQQARRYQISTLETAPVDKYYLYQLGCTYTEARAGLKAVQEEINKILRGFGDLDEEDIQAITGSSLAVARRAKAREFSEYFITPSRIEIEAIQKVAKEYGFKILRSEKLSLMMGQNAAVESAAQWLVENYRAVCLKRVFTVGIGSISENLKNLDASIPLTCSNAEKGKNIATWIKAVRQTCQEYNIFNKD